MNTRNCLMCSLAFSAAGAALNVSAEPYQLQVQGTFAQFESGFSDSDSLEGDVLSLSVLYFPQMVDITKGPLAERPFVDKSGFITGSITQTKPDFAQDIDTTVFSARFVTQGEFIFPLV